MKSGQFLVTLVTLCLLIHFEGCMCKPKPSSKVIADAPAVPSPEGTTSAPWLRFLKKKKNPVGCGTSSSELTTTIPPQPTNKLNGHPAAALVVPPSPTNNALRSVDPQPSPLAEWLGISVQPSGNILAENREKNPGSVYDELYLDWVKRDVGDSEPEVTTVSSVAVAQQDPVAPAQAPPPPSASAGFTYGFPSVPLTYGYAPPMFPYLAGFKMQKAMESAALEAMLGITTTPKPMKLKLKITVPGNVNVTQLGQITSGLTNVLPPGSTYELN